MGSFSIWHWAIVAVVALVLFGGKGKIPSLMKDMGKGITAFKKGLKDEDKAKDDSDDALEDKTVNVNTEKDKTE